MKYRIVSLAVIVGLLAQVALAPHAAVYASDLRSPPPATVLSETAPASPLVDCPEDKAGDKPPDAASISPGTTVGTICPKGDVDFYRFNPPPGEKLAIALDDLPANFDLCLIFPDATETCSTQTGTNAETIKAEAKNGIHYLRVFGEMGAASALPYKLHLAVGAAVKPPETIVEDLPGQVYFSKTRYAVQDDDKSDEVFVRVVISGTLPAVMPDKLQAWVSDPHAGDSEPVLLQKVGERAYESKDGLPLVTVGTPLYDGRLTTTRGNLIYALFWWNGQKPGATGDVALVSGGAPSGKFTYKIDSSILTDPKTLPGEGDGESPRPVAAIASPGYPPVRMGEDAVIFDPRSSEEREAFLKRRNGAFVQEREQNGIGVVRVNLDKPAAVDLTDFQVLAGWLGMEGELVFSSEELLWLYAMILDENFDGLRITFNPLMMFFGEPEGSEDPALQPFDEWWSVDATVNTSRAWVLGALLDVEETPVNVALIDGGFRHGPDVIEPLVDGYDYEDEDGDPFGENPVSCSGDGDCPWHGDTVWGACGAVVNNGANVAGAGGQVARPMFYRTGYSSWLFDMDDVYHRAVDRGADVINMSAGMPCRLGGIHYCNPAVRGGICTAVFLALPLIMGLLPMTPEILLGLGLFTVALGVFCFNAFNPERTFADAADYAADHGTVVVAAAGNTVGIGDSTYGPYDVSEVAVVPCIVDNVICVGEMAADGTLRNNWGDAVDIWGPTDLPRSNDVTNTIAGTSGSTGFISGVAALMKSINRDLTPDEIRTILRDSGHASPVEPLIHHYVDVYAALVDAYGSTLPTDADLADVYGFCHSYGWDETGAGNDTAGSATTVATGAGDIGPIDDAALHTFADAEDWYRLDLPDDTAGRVYEIDETIDYATRAGTVRSQLHVQLPSGLEPTRARTVWPNTFYLRTFFDTPADDTCYNLEGTVTAGVLRSDRLEVNDSLPDASSLTGWESVGDGAHQLDVPDLTIHAPDDEDFFSIEPPPGASLPLVPICPIGVSGGFYLSLTSPEGYPPIWVTALYDSSGTDRSPAAYMNDISLDAGSHWWAREGFSLRVEGDQVEAALDGYGLHVEYYAPDPGDVSAICALWEDIEVIVMADLLTHGSLSFIPDSPEATQMLAYPFDMPCDPRVCDPPSMMAADYLLFARGEEDVLNLEATTPAASKLRFQLLNTAGVVLGEAKPPTGAQEAADSKTLSLTLPRLPAGVYLVKVSEGEFGVHYRLRVSGSETLYLPNVYSSTD